MTNLSKDFHDYEFFCPCGKCRAKRISPTLVTKLQQLRDLVGEPVYITSGYRCKAYNKKIGGYSKSPHLLGKAADIQTKNMFHPNLPFVLAYTASEIRDIRIGIYPNHLHIDIMPPTPSKYWLVKKYGQKPIYSKHEKNLAKFLKNNL